MSPEVAELMTFFKYSHLPEHLQNVAAPCSELAREMVSELKEGTQLVAGLQKLIEAKDCFVRSAVVVTNL